MENLTKKQMFVTCLFIYLFSKLQRKRHLMSRLHCIQAEKKPGIGRDLKKKYPAELLKFLYLYKVKSLISINSPQRLEEKNIQHNLSK